MSIIIPTPDELAQRMMAALAQAQFRASDGTLVTIDPTAPSTFEQVLVSVQAMALYETYLYIRDRFLEQLPTTATVGNGGLLPQHGQIWGVPRIAPQAAVGKVVIAAVQAVSIPQGVVLTSDGSVQWVTTQAVSIPAGGSVSVTVTCQTTGTIGNLAEGATLSLVSPVAGVSKIIVDQGGLTGGADIESVESWRGRIIEAIRTPYDGGTANDYRRWAASAGAAFVNVVPAYTGLGTVGVIVAFAGPRVPSSEEVARVQSYIDERRPVRGNATVYPAEIVTGVPVVRLGLDNQVNRDKVSSAFAAIYSGVGIGGTLYVEALQAALFGAVGGNSAVIAPTQDIVFEAAQIPVMGAVTWQ